ncbi:MAG TPA: molecular chaperone TorD family protein, partial [Albitalea sp.]|nr:molecular chaperone TorD family protein [Albitalea sp.]
MTTAQALHFSTPDDSEELARAEVYGLLSQLFYAPPSAELYSQLQVAATVAPAPGAFLESSWTELVAASRRRSREQVADEYDALFLGIGKPEVFLYGSHHIAGALNEKPLVALRDTLAALGLARSQAMAETEDHIAYLCEAMRFLIAGDDAAVCNLASQQRLFNAHLRTWSDTMWEQIAGHPAGDFYRALALFAQ